MSTTTKWILAVAILLLLLLSLSFYRHSGSFNHSPDTMAQAPAPLSSNGQMVTTLAGTIKDSAGNPIDHAYVSQGFSPYAGKIFHYTYTDADGHFSIPNVRVGDDLMLAALANGYSPQVFRHGTVVADMPESACTLLPGHTIRFRFLDERGHPIPNVVVSPTIGDTGGIDLRTHNFISGSHGNPPYDDMLSDSEGRFVWNSAPADQVFFFLSTYDEKDSYRLGRKQLGPSDQENVIVLRDVLQASGTVVDNESGAPIPEFNYFVGQGNDKQQANGWDAFPVHGAEGKWTRKLTDVLPFTFIRVEAPGYAPVTQSFSEELKSVSLSFRLSKSAGTVLTILQPDKQPAVDTRVYIAGEQKDNPASFYFPNGNPVTEWSSPSDPPFVKTDEQGECHLPDLGKTPTRIIIIDDSGFTEMSASDLKNNQVVTLEPWAHIDAHIKIGPHPAPRTAIALSIELKATANAPRVRMELPGRTDADGNFSYPRIPPRPLTIARSIDANPGTRFYIGALVPSQDLTPSPGETVTVTLGGTGQFVTGRIVVPDTHKSDLTWMLSLGRIGAVFPTRYTPQEREELATLTPEEKQRRMKELYTPARWEVFEKALKASRLAHPGAEADFSVAPDGTFYADGATPGESMLSVQALDPTTGSTIATATHNFTVPPTPTTQPIDLGEITMEKTP